ncbi:hypothetical protein H072_1611 [Dactylellina haptotyla CBS 200.50]|uniref:SAYSvFN domain-containing protein n=1 Tax=Dactylellina haptotyla (strain CBS 200.50) TaxID=1284197 RepID=S8BY47_DACHA|nr:hypothetical protein H072_1611 [Dactylellina haptotyla CBS 200.50]
MSAAQRKPPKDKAKDKASKKPYHIKRADLELEDYQLQQEQKSFALLATRGFNALIHSRQFYVYLLLQAIAAWFKLGQGFLCVGILWMMYANTGKRKAGEKSSWSVFNEGFEAIEGSTDMEALEREMRSRGL